MPSGLAGACPNFHGDRRYEKGILFCLKRPEQPAGRREAYIREGYMEIAGKKAVIVGGASGMAR
ncbi:MAG: hypothetical protein JWM19_1185, partial [Actinomycetia bacterium]|nr:hypothetical protein [Actinomycetes bacterium]